MIRRRVRWLLVVLAVVVLAAACNQPIEIIGEGDVLSESGSRDCVYADFRAGSTNCTENEITGAYDETYTAEAAPGWHFHRWVNYCTDAVDNTCSFDISADAITQLQGVTANPLVAIFRPDVNTGFDTFLMGHSFFSPFSEAMYFHPENAGFVDHTQQHFYSWNASGAPEALWNHNSKRATIQGILDAGDVDLFGMTYHPTYPGPDGYLNWVDYALEQNPDTRIVIAIPWLQGPMSMDTATFATTWYGQVETDGHALIELLRSQHPGADISVMPYGEAAIVLRQMFDAGELPDVTQLHHDVTGIFTDQKGHAAPILVELGSLVWLKALYGVDLSTYDYDPGYQTDLKAVAEAIVDGWDPTYTTP